MFTKYQKRISGSLLDRIDTHIEVPRVDHEKLSDDRVGETFEAIRKRVQAARKIQQLRFTNYQAGIICNADIRVGDVRPFCKLQGGGQSLMRAAMREQNLSARAWYIAQLDDHLLKIYTHSTILVRLQNL